MTPERWQQIKQILDACAARPDEELSPWLDDACGGDAELRREVESLLAQEDRLTGFIEEPAVPLRRERDDVGRRVGPYRLTRLLGRGGMGAVYLAVREGEFEQRVALKLVQDWLVNDDLVRRFHAERQILARLEHPAIARLLDGGTTADGLPYFAMEYVEGIPIDRYCDAHRLDTGARLRLFLEVCSALELAHRNLVVHRDLKPGNILVDAAGTPKLLDFGIAKLLRDDLDPRAELTRTQQPMTLRYASPEQVRQEPITTASDIYSLGVLLYRLLTGHLPYPADATSYPQLIQAVCEEVPPRPSEVVGKTVETPLPDGGTAMLTPQTVSRARDGDPKTLRRHLAGDVDAIVAKALRKEPQQRYPSVERLAEDIRRHLGGRPVQARQGTFLYRAGRFARRHRWALATAAAVVLLAGAFTLALVRQLGETERERDRAARVSSFLENLFKSAAPDRAAGEELTARQILERGRANLAAGLEAEPEVRVTLQETLARVYRQLGHYEEARQLLEPALALRRRLHPADHPALATAINDLAVVAQLLGDDTAAEPLLREAIAMRRRLGEEEDLIKPLNNLASIHVSRGELDAAEELYRQGLAMRRARYGDGHPRVATSLRSLATVLYVRGDLDGAEPLLREALAIRRAHGRRSTAVANALSSLGRLEHARGRLEPAEALYTEALAIRRELLGDDHPHVAVTRKDYAALLLARGETATAGVLITRALSTLYPTRAEDDWTVADAESVLGVYLAATGQLEEAEVCLTASLRTLEQQRGSQAIYTREARRRLEEVRRARGG